MSNNHGVCAKADGTFFMPIQTGIRFLAARFLHFVDTICCRHLALNSDILPIFIGTPHNQHTQYNDDDLVFHAFIFALR
jgi:hypothetical protein